MSRSDARFHRLVEALDGIIWEADAATLDFHYVSAQVKDILGYTADEWLAQPDFWQSRLHPDDADWVMDACAAATAAGEPHRLTYRMVARDGRAVWLQDNVTISTQSGRAMLNGAMLDISRLMDEARIMEELDRRKGHYQAFYDLVPVALWHEDWSGLTETLAQLRSEGVQDLDAHIDANPGFIPDMLARIKVLNVNRAAVTMYGARSADDLITRAINIFEADRHDSIFRQSMRAIWNGQREIEGTSVLRRLDKTQCQVTFRASLPGLEDGNGRALLSEMDITEMHDANQRLEMVTRATSDVIWDFDIISDNMWASDGLQRNFDLNPDDMRGSLELWTNRIHPDDVPDLMAQYNKIVHDGANDWHREYRFLHGQGHYVTVRDSGFIIRDQDGHATRMVGSLVDITSQRQLEDRLNQSQRLEAIGRLTGGIAHDFNNLLTVILGNLEIIGDAVGDAPALRASLDSALHAVDRSAELINRLLAFSRNQPLEITSCKLGSLLEQMRPLLQSTLGETITIDMDIPDDLWDCSADPVHLESAVLNLAINARDAMPAGGCFTITASNAVIGTATVPEHIGLAAGNYIRLSVRDTGEGMDEITRQRAFDPFFTTKEVGKGTGLGLSMVHGFVTQSNGAAQIASRPNEGTTVLIYLPCPDTVTGERLVPQWQGDMAHQSSEVSRNSASILLVEDQTLVRDYVVNTLSGLGYHVLSASDAAEAFDLLANDASIDLLLTDIILPGGVSGIELAERAKSLRPGLPVIYTSGYSGDHLDQNARLIVGENFLWKPYRRNDLARILRASLKVDAGSLQT